jgi:tetratricopeptide (TPR) repeat protein
MAILFSLVLFCLSWLWTPHALAAESQSEPQFQGIPLSCYVSVSQSQPLTSEPSPEQESAQNLAQSFTLLDIADKYISAKLPDRATELLDQAVELAGKGTNNSAKAYLLVDVADRYRQTDHQQTALATLAKAFTLVKGFTNQIDRVFATVKIARAYDQLGERDKAQRMLKQSLVAAKDIVDVYGKSRAYDAIASGLTAVGDKDSASESVAKGIEYARMALDTPSRARALLEVAATYAELQDHPQAIRYTQLALDTVRQEIPQIYQQDFNARALALIVERYLATNQPEQAEQVLTNIPDTSIEKGIGLLNLSSRYRKSGDKAKAEAVIDQSLSKISALPDSLDKSAVLSEIAEGYKLLDNLPKSAEVLAQSAKVVQTLTSVPEKIYALTSLASLYADRQELDTAKTYLDQALDLIVQAESTKPLPNRERALADVAGLYWQSGDREKALTLADQLQPGLQKSQITALFACAKQDS